MTTSRLVARSPRALRWALTIPALACLLVTLGACSVTINPALLIPLNRGTTTALLSPVPASILDGLTTIPESEFEAVGSGSAQTQFSATPAHTALLTANGRPEVIFVGAEYCPYCAAQRWSMIVALSRFGSFSGLKLMRSSPNDVYPNTPTFTFRSAQYTSQYFTLSATETEDRNQNQLATPHADITTSFTQYDSSGSIPFVSYGDQYITIGSAFNPTMLQNLDWRQVVDQLKDPQSAAAQAIIGDANQQTAALCALTSDQPANVCATPIIQRLEKSLPVAQ